MSNHHRNPDDDDTSVVKTVAAIVPAALQHLTSRNEAVRLKRRCGLVSLHQRQRDLEAGRKLNPGGAK